MQLELGADPLCPPGHRWLRRHGAPPGPSGTLRWPCPAHAAAPSPSPGRRSPALPLHPPDPTPCPRALPWHSEGPRRELARRGFREIPLHGAQRTPAALNLTCSSPSKLLVPCNCLNLGSINVQAVKIKPRAKRPISHVFEHAVGRPGRLSPWVPQPAWGAGGLRAQVGGVREGTWIPRFAACDASRAGWR